LYPEVAVLSSVIDRDSSSTVETDQTNAKTIYDRVQDVLEENLGAETFIS
jgi:hypothetical protein